MLKNMSEIRKIDRARLPCLRKVAKENLLTEVRRVDESLKKIESKHVAKDNDLFYLEAAFVTKVFDKTKIKVEKKQSWWKRSLESQVKELSKDLWRLNELLEVKKLKKKYQGNSQKRYK